MKAKNASFGLAIFTSSKPECLLNNIEAVVEKSLSRSPEYFFNMLAAMMSSMALERLSYCSPLAQSATPSQQGDEALLHIDVPSPTPVAMPTSGFAIAGSSLHTPAMDNEMYFSQASTK